MLAVNGFDSEKEKYAALLLTYGFPPVPIAVAEISKGPWQDIILNINWSQSAVGYVQAWLNGNEISNGKTYGANMWNKASHYFKFGLYRNPDIYFSQSIYYHQIHVGHKRNKVEIH